MPYDSKAIANHFIDLARDEGVPLTPMKLQKLVYYAHGWNLAIKDKPLIDEQVEAWAFGPVIPSLYRAFSEYGNRPITAHAIDWQPVDEHSPWEPVEPFIDGEPEAVEFTRALLRKIWDIYGKYSAAQLSNMTHAPGTPWRQVHDQYHGQIPRGTDIPTELIRGHFDALAKPKVVG